MGAGSGRAVVGVLEDGKLRMKEISRFTNAASPLGGRLYWDACAIWNRILEATQSCAALGYNRLAGIGIDAWGVDFGLLDAGGKLLGTPICYRDSLTEGVERRI